MSFWVVFSACWLAIIINTVIGALIVTGVGWFKGNQIEKERMQVSIDILRKTVDAAGLECQCDGCKLRCGLEIQFDGPPSTN